MLAYSPDQPVIVQGDTSAGNPVPSFAVSSATEIPAGRQDRRCVHADPVHTDGRAELQRPVMAARLRRVTGPDEPAPVMV